MIDESKIIGIKNKRILFLGSINFKKGPMLLVHAFKAIHDYDPEFTLHIFGAVQDPRAALFLDISLPDLKLQDSVGYYGHVDNPREWMKFFRFCLVSSPLEGSPVGLLECCAEGLHPLVYSFYGAEQQYPSKYIWKSIPELVEIIKKPPFPPEEIKKFVAENYSLDKQLSKITDIVADLAEKAKKTPKITPKSTTTAIIAVKNGSKTIKRTINSLLNQTKPLDKIIVVNDGSTDDTEDIVRGFFDTSKVPIEIITNPKSQWVFSARNTGFKKVDTDYFFFLDADDWVDPQYVQKMNTILDENSDMSVVYSDMIYFNENNEEQVFQVPDFDPQILVQRNFIAYSAMQRTSAFKNIGCYSDYLNDCRNHLVEWDLWLRYVKVGAGFKRLAEPLFHYFSSGDDQMSHNYERSRQDMHLQMAIGITEGGKDIQMVGDKKRVLLVVQGQDYCDRSQVGFELMTLAKPLEMGGQHEVYVFQYDVEMQYYGRDEMLKRLQIFADLVKPAYIFHFSYKDAIPVEVWSDLSKEYNTIVLHSDSWRYDEFSKDYEKGFKYAVTPSPDIYKRMDHPGKILSQWAANQHYFYPREKDIEVSFTGQANQNRPELLKGLDIECYGLGWPSGFVSYSNMASILGRSKISISLSMGVRGRQRKLHPFEITASKALCICEQMPGIEESFAPYKEIVLFDTKEELADLVKYYLEHPEEAEAIAQAGYDRTMKEHLWEHRLKEIFLVVDENNA